MNNMQILCMDAAGETGEVIFRTPCSAGSGERERQLLDALKGLVANYDIERRWHNARGGDDYEDNLSIRQARAAIAAATEGAES